MPLSCGCGSENVFPAATKTLDVTVAVELLLLERDTVTPPAGAGDDRVTGNTADSFSPTVSLVNSEMVPDVDC
jgi:hypothetical protein